MSGYLTSPSWNRPRGLRSQALRLLGLTGGVIRNMNVQARDDIREFDLSRLVRCVAVGVVMGILSVLLLFIVFIR